MSNFVVTLQDLKKSYNSGKIIIDGLSLSFLHGAKIGVLGHNGSGKSTLLKIIAGLDLDYSGDVWKKERIKIGYLPQEPILDFSLNVKENIMQSLQDTLDVLQRYNDISMKFAEPMTEEEMQALLEQQDVLYQQVEAANAWDLDRSVEVAMDALRCPPSNAAISALSGGEKRRVALCKLLLENNDMLLLDEPTNHLDAESVAWLERYLRDYKGTVMIVTHDRYFLDNVTGWILELDKGIGYPYQGNYSAWLDQKQIRLQQEDRAYKNLQKVLKRELEWINQSPKARQSKSKSRISSYETLLAHSKQDKGYSSSLVIPPGPRLGDMVINFNGISKGFNDSLLIDNFSFKVPKGAIVGIIGPNGAGKSTLFKIITQKESPDSGGVEIGDSVILGYIDQSRDSLNDNNTVWEEISGGNDEVVVGNKVIQSRSYVAQFNFKSTDQQKSIGVLSGGERNRVHLAKMLKQGANVLLLDEPTNDLDLETLRALEEAIVEFYGCVLVISHDRWFLDRISTHIVSFEGNSSVVWCEGNYQDYEKDKIKRLGSNAMSPRPIKYKPFNI